MVGFGQKKEFFYPPTPPMIYIDTNPKNTKRSNGQRLKPVKKTATKSTKKPPVNKKTDGKAKNIPSAIKKGKSLIAYLNNYTAIDIETTGRSYKTDRITEIAAVKVRGGRIQQRKRSFVNPQMSIPKIVTKITGITNDMVKDKPTINEVLPNFIKFIGKDVVVAHNANTFDILFISAASYRINRKWFLNDFVDTLKISRLLFKGYESHKLSSLAARCGVAIGIEHRALQDAVKAHRCYKYMKKHKLNLNKTYATRVKIETKRKKK